jgi:hypothetical protein
MSDYNTGEKGDKRPFSPWVKKTMARSKAVGASGITDREYGAKHDALKGAMTGATRKRAMKATRNFESMRSKGGKTRDILKKLE